MSNLGQAAEERAEAAETALFRAHGLEAETVWITLPTFGTRVRVTVCGEGDPLVVLPGGSGEAFGYIPLMAALPGRRWIAINRPGGGLSDFIDHRRVDLRRLSVELLDAVLDNFGIERADLVANSMGGLWAFWYAQSRPERVRRLVELGCPALLLGTTAPAFIRLLAAPGLGQLVSRLLQPATPEAAAAGLRRGMGIPETVPLSAGLLETAVAMFALPPFRQTWRTLIAAVLAPSRGRAPYGLSEAELREIVTPVLFIWGARDPFGSLDVARKACEVMPSARLEVLGAGHLPFVEEPEATGALIAGFMPITSPAADRAAVPS